MENPSCVHTNYAEWSSDIGECRQNWKNLYMMWVSFFCIDSHSDFEDKLLNTFTPRNCAVGLPARPAISHIIQCIVFHWKELDGVQCTYVQAIGKVATYTIWRQRK